MTYPSWREWHPELYARLLPYMGDLGRIGNLTPVVGRVYLQPIQILFTLTIDQICYVKDNVIAGNVRAGLYESAVDLPDTGALLADTGSVAMSALGDRRQHIDLLADLQLYPALYYIALEFSDVTARASTASYFATRGDVPPELRSYDLGAFLALTNPCPVTVQRVPGPITFVRVASIP